ncbi:Uncharacterised protein [Mycobacteroides abscessus subsp. abscessus]|nr:Uncharacterised protein [Mycobacteroides abscessus subsp. abscessus]
MRHHPVVHQRDSQFSQRVFDRAHPVHVLDLERQVVQAGQRTVPPEEGEAGVTLSPGRDLLETQGTAIELGRAVEI